MRLVVFLLLIAVSVGSRSAECERWTANTTFKIQGASYSETIAWIAGWTEAITNINGDSGELHVCIPKCRTRVSKEIVDILNSKFDRQTISAETAASAIWPALKGRLACPKPTASADEIRDGLRGG
jgi:hypothetical protein